MTNEHILSLTFCKYTAFEFIFRSPAMSFFQNRLIEVYLSISLAIRHATPKCYRLVVTSH